MKNHFLFFPLAVAVAGCTSAPQAGTNDVALKSGASPILSVHSDKALPPAPKDAEGLIKWSMDHYASLPMFEAEETFVMTTPTSGAASGMQNQKRKILYQKPNLYKVVATRPSIVQTSISDGKNSIDYSSMGMAPISSPAPESIAKADSMQMKHPMFCGSLIYQFFGGSENYEKLVDVTKGAPTLDKEESLNGEKCQDVKFYSVGEDGNTIISIGEKDGLVHKITYDSAPLVKMMVGFKPDPSMKKMLKDSIDKMPVGASKDAAIKGLESINNLKEPGVMQMKSTETFDRMTVPISVPPNAFDVTPPKGTRPIEMPHMGAAAEEKPPVPIGQPAPDFAITDASGKQTKLSSLKGQVVLVDFWATWCPPCKKGLPETNKLAMLGEKNGFKVMAVSDEPEETIAKFCRAYRYSFKQYRDEGDAAEKIYAVTGIPTTLIIDVQGNLQAYLVGLREPGEIEAALKKAGAKL